MMCSSWCLLVIALGSSSPFFNRLLQRTWTEGLISNPCPCHSLIECTNHRSVQCALLWKMCAVPTHEKTLLCYLKWCREQWSSGFRPQLPVCHCRFSTAWVEREDRHVSPLNEVSGLAKAKGRGEVRLIKDLENSVGLCRASNGLGVL